MSSLLKTVSLYHGRMKTPRYDLKVLRERELLDARETGALLGVSRPQVYKLISEGKLPIVKLDRQIRVHRESLTKMLVEKVRKSAA